MTHFSHGRVVSVRTGNWRTFNLQIELIVHTISPVWGDKSRINHYSKAEWSSSACQSDARRLVAHLALPSSTGLLSKRERFLRKGELNIVYWE